MTPGRVRLLVAVVIPQSDATGRPCGRCGVHIDGGPIISMRRPGATRGVTWCRTCAQPYMEVDNGRS